MRIEHSLPPYIPPGQSAPNVAALGLEDTFPELFQCEVDTHQICPFDLYLSPNEGHPEAIAAHFDSISTPFTLVGTGTERNFFHLLIAEGYKNPKCQNLVIVDINPKVKAYVDFNIMLLRISKDREEYVRLSSEPQADLREKIEQNTLPAHVKAYYLKNLEDFAAVYYSAEKKWRDPSESSFALLRYTHDEELFTILHTWAQEGRIAAKIGDINDLNFLGARQLVVDVSNIPDYTVMNFEASSAAVIEKVIWTAVAPKLGVSFRKCIAAYTAGYYSEKAPSLPTEKQRKELNDFLLFFQKTGSFQERGRLGRSVCTRFRLPDENLLLNNEKLLGLFRKYKDEFCIQIPGVGQLDFSYGPMGLDSNVTLERLNNLSLEECKTIHSCLPGYAKPGIVHSWRDLDAERYKALVSSSGDPEWQTLLESRAV